MSRTGSSRLLILPIFPFLSGNIIPETPEMTLPVSSSQKETPKPEVSAYTQKHIEAPLPPLQPRPTRERLELPFSSDARLSGFEDLHLPSSDQFTMWGKMTSEEILAEHVVDIHRIAADFRDALERIEAPTSWVNKLFSSQSPMQRRLSVYNWNPGPRRGTEDAIEKQIAGKWHLITLQEDSDYVEHEILHERFHVTHFAGCAVLFDKDTFYPDISVKSIYLHDMRRGAQDHIVEGEHGWVLQKCSVTCLFSSYCSQRSESLHRIVVTHQQCLCQKKKRYRQKIYPDRSCSYDYSEH